MHTVLTNTFDDVFEEASLMSRLSFAIGIYKLEVRWRSSPVAWLPPPTHTHMHTHAHPRTRTQVMAQSFGMPTEVGELRQGKRVYIFRTFKGGEEGQGASIDEVSDPFAPPRPSETASELEAIQTQLRESRQEVRRRK